MKRETKKINCTSLWSTKKVMSLRHVAVVNLSEADYWEGGEALAKSCGWPTPGTVHGQVGQGFEKHALVKGVPAHNRGQHRGWNYVIFKVSSNTSHPMNLRLLQKFN